MKNEVGTSNGYSTIWLALAAMEMGGKVVTIEYDKKKVDMARKNFKMAGLENQIELIHGDALKILPGLRKKFDFAFLDATKEEHLTYFQLIFPKMKKGALIISDNVIFHQNEMKPFLSYVRKNGDGRWNTILIPIGSGEELTLKIRD